LSKSLAHYLSLHSEHGASTTDTRKGHNISPHLRIANLAACRSSGSDYSIRRCPGPMVAVCFVRHAVKRTGPPQSVLVIRIIIIDLWCSSTTRSLRGFLMHGLVNLQECLRSSNLSSARQYRCNISRGYHFRSPSGYALSALCFYLTILPSLPASEPYTCGARPVKIQLFFPEMMGI
jgi:hypothetical protein